MGRGSWEIAEDPLADGIKKTHFEIGIMKIHLLVWLRGPIGSLDYGRSLTFGIKTSNWQVE